MSTHQSQPSAAPSSCELRAKRAVSLRRASFSSLSIGDEFWWGGYPLEVSAQNWGRKRSSRTVDYRIRLNGELLSHMDWVYWTANEVVYVAH